LDPEELFFPLSIILLISGLVSAALIYFPTPFSGFHLFILSIACLIVSFIFLIADLILAWPLEEQTCYYVPRTQNNSTNVEATTPQPQMVRLEKSEVSPPTKEQLQALKEALGLEEGSLQYKKRGQGIYAVLYSEGKHHWNHLGSWKELRQKLDV